MKAESVLRWGLSSLEKSKEKSGVFCSHRHLKLSPRMRDSEAEGDSIGNGILCDLEEKGSLSIFVLNTEAASDRTWEVQQLRGGEAGSITELGQRMHTLVPEHTQGSQQSPRRL